MTRPLRVLVAGCGNMGASHARAYHQMPEFEIAGLVSRGPASRARAQQGAGRPPGVRGLLPGARGHAPRRREHQHVSRDPRRLRASRHRGRLPRLLREAAGRDRRGGAVHRRRRAARQPQAGDRLHPARPPGVDAVHRDRPDARQAAGDADEPEPAEPWPELELAPQPDGLDEPDRRLRRPLRRRHVPDDQCQTHAGLGRLARASPTS